MKKTIKKFATLALAAGMLLTSLAGCGNGGNAGGQAAELNNTDFKLEGEAVKSDKVLTTLVNIQPPPAFNGNPYDTAGLDWSVQPLMFDYLAEFSPFPEKTFKPALLEDYTLEGTVLTMKLKEGLVWSDGSPLTADDVMTNYLVNVGKSTVWTYAESIEKIDELTVQITYVNESPLLLNIAFALPIMSPASEYGEFAEKYKDIADNMRELNPTTGAYKYTEEGSTRLAEVNNELLAYKPDPTTVICSGPYILTNATTSEVMFVKNENYRLDVPVEKVRGLRAGSSESFATSILEKQYTVENGGLSPDMSLQVDKRYQDTMRKVFVPELSQIGYAFNYSKYPVNVPEVRKAISMATDRETLVSIAEPGSFLSDTHNSGLMPTLIDSYTEPGFIDTLPDYGYNPEGAEAMLESIGWTRDNQGKWLDENGESVKIEVATINSWPTFMLTAEAMATMLAEFGFNIDFKPMEGGTIWTHLSSGDQMIGGTFLGGAGTYAHPWEAFSNIYTSTRLGLPELQANEHRILVAPTTGKEYDVTEMLQELFMATDDAEIKRITQDFMTLTNDLGIFMPVVEKSAPLRIYDTTLSMPDAEAGEIQQSFYYFGTMNQMVAKMLKSGEIYFTE